MDMSCLIHGPMGTNYMQIPQMTMSFEDISQLVMSRATQFWCPLDQRF